MPRAKVTEESPSHPPSWLPAIPRQGKESLVRTWPWLAVIFGMVQFVAAAGLWYLLSTARELAMTQESTSDMLTLDITTQQSIVVYLGIALLVISGVLFLLAVPFLLKRASRGWWMIVIGISINLSYGVLLMLIDNRGWSGFLFTLIGSLAGLYILFQIRRFYKPL